MLSNRYKNDQKSLLTLTKQQQLQKERVQQHMDEKFYTLEESPCLICNSPQFETLAEKDRYGLPCSTAICQSCGLIQTTPRMNQSSYNHFYNDGHRNLYVGAQSPDLTYINRRIKVAEKTTAYLAKHLSLSGIRILEVGCGIGALLYTLQKKGALVEGIDLSETYLVAGKAHFNLHLHTTDLFQLNPSKPYDLIIYSDVFEHLLDPTAHLQQCKKLLTDNGTLFIKVPGVRNIIRPYLNDFLRMLQNAHITYFSADTLTNLLSQNQFSQLHCNEQIMSLWKPNSKAAPAITNYYTQTIRFLKKKENQHLFRSVLSGAYDLKNKLNR